MAGWHELNTDGTDCAADCTACCSAQAKKEHEDAHLPRHATWDEKCPACQNFDKWLARRLGVPFINRTAQAKKGSAGPDAKLLKARWASLFGEPEDFRKAMEELPETKKPWS